ncbi:MAG: succinate dehydrogenase, cytochrome b556 subunit [Alphaproteobacteria bacterium]|nr:succinate dehydrogenase, cytochrome b556 subunit [Alphaproteobacteria bacterium]MDA8003763.1 succinate dehydrogenase, cytochrome b556 subunit [Alphaproteobacteria bacterium]MDA8005673.1 succinate dehydrogenase, cytochrome b556 subunit [Alphaproteobacteria bacterium]MDA8010682.1 succinate dehydrogenase, cytochrome b556 subunit [Alphaproteobacteria bacterium]MDA8013385.1 succinate dehydrogenase, cytochrome b556 subunit [Alphaproteobacteria bacterium]
MSDNERQRPVSPHLGWYRWQLTSLLSISHRVTGAALILGLLLLSLWTLAAGLGPGAYNFMSVVLGSWLGKLVLFGFTLAFFFHLLNGARHLCWDLVRGMELPQVYRSGYLVLALTVIFTLAAWFLAYALRPEIVRL